MTCVFSEGVKDKMKLMNPKGSIIGYEKYKSLCVERNVPFPSWPDWLAEWLNQTKSTITPETVNEVFDGN